MMRPLLLAFTLTLAATTAAPAAPLIFDVCGGILEIQAPLNTSYAGPVRFEGRVFCQPTRVTATVDGKVVPINILDFHNGPDGMWGWEAPSTYYVKGCHDFTVAVAVTCDPVTPVHSAASHFCIR